MGIGSLSNSNNVNKTKSSTSFNVPDQYLLVNFNYVDKTLSIQIEDRIRFLPKTKIHTLAEEFLAIDEQDTISPNKIILVAVSLGGRLCTIPKHNTNSTLQDLKIKSGSLLCFEPLEDSKRCKLSQLILYGPDNTKTKIYQWKEESTTVYELLQDIIKIFSLSLFICDNIQLCTFSNENLNRSNNSEKLLKDFGLVNYSSIFVTCVQLGAFHKYDQNTYLHIESSLHGKASFYASLTDTLCQLTSQIERRFPPCYHIETEFYNADFRPFYEKDFKCNLKVLGVESSETINVIIKEQLRKGKMSTLNQSSVRLQLASSNKKICPVYVQCKLSSCDNTIIEVSAEDTVAEVMKKISTLKKHHSTAQFRLYSDSINIDHKEADRSLIEFDIKPGSTIYASAIDMASESSTANKEIDLLPKSLSNAHNNSKPIGLDNLGNTCFMNSALQCLIHIKPFTKFFLEKFTQVHVSDIRQDDYNPFDSCGEMTSTYAVLVRNMIQPDTLHLSYNYSFRPTRMKEVIGYIAPNFSNSDQQDAQEFITFLLDAMHEELQAINKSGHNTIIQQLFFGTLQSKVTCLNCKHITISTNRISILPIPLNYCQRIFSISFLTSDGIQERIMMNIADNGHIENLVQEFLDIQHLSHLFCRIIVIGAKSEEQIPFKTPLKQLSEDELILIEQDENMDRIAPNRFDTENSNVNLEECLQAFISVEPLDDLWFCQEKTCQRKTSATKQLSFNSLPPVIIIQLKRFSYINGIRRKLYTFVNFPLNELNLSQLLSVSSLSLKQEKVIYDLIAVSNHIGSINSGHYTTYARQEPDTDEWYEFNDSNVSVIYSKSKIVSEDAYLLFYVKRTK